MALEYKIVLKFLADYLTKKGFRLEKGYGKLNLSFDLGLDSMDLIGLFSELEKNYHKPIDIDDYEELELDIIGNLAKYISTNTHVDNK